MKICDPGLRALSLLSSRLLAAGLLAALLLAVPGGASAEDGGRAALGVAVFAFELDDFTAGGPIGGESPDETRRLVLISERARRSLAALAGVRVIDPSSIENDTMRAHWLRHCNGCEADLARDAGAERSLLGVVRKLSVMQQMLEFRVRDSRTGAVLLLVQTDLRGSTDESWSRATDWLIANRLVPAMDRIKAP